MLSFYRVWAPFSVRALIAASALQFFVSDPVAGAGQATASMIQPLKRPDTESITVPNLEFTPTPADDYGAYSYFHKVGVSYETAFADFDQCRIYTLTTGVIRPPKFAALGTNLGPELAPAPDNFKFGLVGALMVEILPPLQQRIYMSLTSRCMGYKGYSRYGTSRGIWQQIAKGSEAEKFARLALIASGPEPTTKAIAP